jgi:hypothetical protein
MSVKEIELAISQLPPSEFSELMSWLEEYHARIWDRQIEDDIEQGRLDKVLEQVKADIAAGLKKPL